MGLKKGKTNNAAGRPKGIPNKVTSDLREWTKRLIEDNREQLEDDLEALEPKERWAIVEKLMQYSIPKMQATTAQIDFNMLSDEQLQTIINELTKNLENE